MAARGFEGGMFVTRERSIIVLTHRQTAQTIIILENGFYSIFLLNVDTYECEYSNYSEINCIYV